MNHVNVLTIALRVAALYLVVSVISNVPEEIVKAQALSQMMEQGTIWLSIVFPSVIKILVAILFWFFPNTLIRTTIPDAQKSEESPEYLKNLNIAIISAVGIYLIGFGLSDIVYYVSLNYEMNKLFEQPPRPEDLAGLYATVFQVTIGFLIVLGSSGISKMVRQVRS
ncbi:hypothetical protein ACFOD0_14660 [Shewanella intestini]|uniref:Solute carrier organic anion transporter n=1 Tax=Shewanella intestini TaxID=2017544 RepID=A0ABS5I4I2_9GAMM|nr:MULTISPECIES: hypothetical protein [Shewanella]MBR9728937.1 solute carrier organic anion transporter [Shewanella intestini]MRG36998.1 hypothetical protein [Shewanella sp. XMDDZSB0408]